MSSEKEELENLEKNANFKIILAWVFLILGLSVFIAIIVGYYYLCDLFMPAYATTLILIVILAFLLKKATYYLLFPGVFYFHRSSLEHKFCLARMRPIIYRVEMMQMFMQCLKKELPEEKLQPLLSTELRQSKLHIDQALQALLVLKSLNKITKFQETLKDIFEKFLLSLDDTLILVDDQTFSITSFITNQRDLDKLKIYCNIYYLREIEIFWISYLKQDLFKLILIFVMSIIRYSISFLFFLFQIQKDSSIKIQDDNKFEQLTTINKQILSTLISIEKGDKKLKKQYKNQTEKALGSLEFALAEFSIQNHVKRFKIIGKDKNEIHGLIVYCKTHYENLQQKSEDPIVQDKSSPTIIYCNGNAGQYEFNYFLDDWTQKVVTEYQVNVVFWSYRGYGYSTGTPSIQNLCKDVETLYDYLKNEEKLGKLGVYGTSLGGFVAGHLGATKKIDFLYVDRSFSCVSDIAYYTMLRIFKYVIRFLTDYDLWSAQNYQKATCYKVLSYDPNDEAIGYMASLVNGYSKQIAQNVFLGINSNDGQYSIGDYSMRKNFKGFWRRTCTAHQTLEQATTLWLSKESQKKLYKSLTNIVKAIKIVSKKVIQIKKQQQITKDLELNIPLQNIKKKIQNSSCNIHFEMDETCLLNNSTVIDNDYIVEQLEQAHQTFLDKSEPYIKSAEAKDIQLAIAQDQNNVQNIIQQSPINQQKNQEQLNLVLPKNKDQFEQIKDIIKSLFTLFDQYDSGGLTLLDCISSSYFPKFQMFILNIFVWGSHPPLELTLVNNPNILDHHRYAKIKTSKFIDKLDTIILKINQSNLSSFQNRDVSIIKDHFVQLYLSMRSSQQLYHGKEYGKLANQAKSQNVTLDAILINSGNPAKNGENDQFHFAEDKLAQQTTQNLIGNLVVLSCGHVEPYSRYEELALKSHFRNSGFI